jgi:hypothetical protein
MDVASLAAESVESACRALLSSFSRSPQPSVAVSLTTVATGGPGLLSCSALLRSSSGTPSVNGPAEPHLISRCLAVPFGWRSAWYLFAKVAGGRREEEAMERKGRLSWKEVELGVFEVRSVS